MFLKIGLVDADLLDNGTRHPNLAQMKISSYCKSRGHDTRLLFGEEVNKIGDYNLIIISKVFDFSILPLSLGYITEMNREQLDEINLDVETTVLKAEKGINTVKAIIGGTGFFYEGGINLSPAIEHIMPDYGLYLDYIDHMIQYHHFKRSYFKDYLDYSIGFTTRGCFRKCSFCVNKKYSKCEKHANVSEFLDPNRPKIYLWDDNFFALFHGWEEILDELKATGKPFQFRQGLDIRLLTDKHAEKLCDCKYYGDFIFAFDHIEDKPLIEKKLAIWRKYTRRETKLYVLCGYEPWNIENGPYTEEMERKDIENTFERIATLMKYRCLPYIMRYRAYKNGRYKGVYVQLARWCNQPSIFKKMSFKQFCDANQALSKSICASMKAYYLLKEDMPDILEKYENLRFEEHPWPDSIMDSE